ncbi:hypothetical protein MVEN_00281400 [Mycena venus]|uniref:Uncharacterized protein n=1 Tax=Mycena venus TaxID=2733690 RepID=A0A8H6Z447_9AGAR|nr:hypothetical protein MVEN_00281400 [Mycena venus]
MSDSKPQDHWYVQLKDVKVPQVNYSELSWKDTIIQRLKGLLAPTTSLAFTETDAYFRRQFKDQVREYSEVRKQIKQLFLVSRSHRLSQLNEIVHQLDLAEPPAQWDDEVDHVPSILQLENKIVAEKLAISPSLLNNTRSYQVMDAAPSLDHLADVQSKLSEANIALLDRYCASIKRTRTLRSHLQDVEDDLANYAHTINTQATAELTYFRGFRDWCQVMVQLTGSLSNSLIAVSTLGAGLAYSTIFGATRGNVGLLCYSFPFFVCGFLLPVIIQVLLQWGASLQKEIKFASQQFWTIVIAVFMSISTLAVMASLTILNFTVFLLKSDSDDSLPDPPSTPVPGIIAFGITGSAFLLILTGLLLSAIALRAFTTLKGVRVVLSAMYGTDGGHADALKLWLPV